MSIIIRANELNTIIYKYLLEAGLSHTAYVMFNEAKLQSSLQEFKYDIKSGHLLTLLQKSLIFSQIQSHVNLGQYNDCTEPFYLLKTHTCKIIQKIAQQNKTFLNELNNNLVECIKRTNAIYNTELVNKNFEEIVYDPRGINYFDKFQKLKILDSGDPDLKVLVKVDGQRDRQLVVWNGQDNFIHLLRNDSFGDLTLQKLYPCTSNSQFSQIKVLKLTPTHLIMVFKNNKLKIVISQFELALQEDIIEIECNPTFDNIVAFSSRRDYVIVNLKNMHEVKRGQGNFKWRAYDEYVLLQKNTCQLRSLLQQTASLTYLIAEKINDESYSQISVSVNNTFYFIVRNNNISVFTFEKVEHLYMFDFADSQELIKKVLWISRNQVDYLCILTDLMVRLWEVELNAYCLKINLNNFDLGQILNIASIIKNTTETYLLLLGTDNLLISDIGTQKIERVESPNNIISMSNVGQNFVYILTDENLYFLNGQRLDQLFK